MLRLILATLFRAGEIEVTYQGNRFHNHQDPASRTPWYGALRALPRHNQAMSRTSATVEPSQLSPAVTL